MNVSVLKYSREFKFKRPIDEVAAFFTGAAQLGSWLSPVLKIEAQLGGEIEFRAEKGFEHGARYEVLDLPSHVVLSTDKFGAIDARFKEVDGATIAQLTFTSEPAGESNFEKVASEAATRFIAMVNYK